MNERHCILQRRTCSVQSTGGGFAFPNTDPFISPGAHQLTYSLAPACSGIHTGIQIREDSKRPPGGGPADQPCDETESITQEKDPGWKEVLLCRTCRKIITSPAERISVQGSHQHTCANPAGILFQLGCFRKAAGCSYTGPPTEEFTWFKGYMWRIAVCSSCLTHLGWLFSSGDERFHGFVLNRLISGETQR